MTTTPDQFKKEQHMKNINNINIDKLLDKFNTTYELLYVNDSIIEYSEATEEFDYLIKINDNFKNLVIKFCDKRKDLISSDREAAAFMLSIHVLLK